MSLSIEIGREHSAVRRRIDPFNARSKHRRVGRIELDDQFGAACETGTRDEPAVYPGLMLGTGAAPGGAVAQPVAGSNRVPWSVAG